MSFPKAELKRFNEITGCAPPVGAYDPKDCKKSEKSAIIDRSDRFKHPKDVFPNSSQESTLSFNNPCLMSTPIKGGARSSSIASNCESSISITKKSVKKVVHVSEKQLQARIKELEQEVRRLQQEKDDKTKELQCLQQELERLQCRQNSHNLERTSCHSCCAQLEHKAGEVTRSLEMLQNQVTELQQDCSQVHAKLEQTQKEYDVLLCRFHQSQEKEQSQLRQEQAQQEKLQQMFNNVQEELQQERTKFSELEESFQQKQREHEISSREHLSKFQRMENQSMHMKENLRQKQLQLVDSQQEACKLLQERDRLLKDQEMLKRDSSTKLADLQAKSQTAEAKVGELTCQLDSLHKKLGDSQEEIRRLSVERSLLDQKVKTQLHALQEAALEERAEYERIISEMSEKIQDLNEKQEISAESEKWRHKYMELFARVEPFMEQLDAFAAERNLLVGRSQTAEAEMAKMMDKYAKLLGHQNQKQKIQYIIKLKDDFLQCRKDKEALMEKSARQQKAIQKLETRILSLEGRRTFDPSQAFKHTFKEDVLRSPLKQTNK